MLQRLSRWWEYKRTCTLLETRSDRLLADIGVQRESIPEVVRQANQERWAVQVRPGDALWPRLTAFREKAARIKRIRRELSGSRDSELSEMGISRVDIPAIARESAA